MHLTLFHRQASPELAEIISQMLTIHGPLVKVRPSAAVVGIPFKRQGSLDGGQLPSSLSGQVGEMPRGWGYSLIQAVEICVAPNGVGF